ncbi:MAG: LysE family transporter [Bacteroidales bacterium]|nr:LysE family transporter [Bacteroidales bacterium]
MLSYLIFAIGFGFACTVQPGPFQALLFSQSILNGWRKTLPLVFVPLLSDIPPVVLVLFILTSVPAGFLTILQCAGGLLLLYMAYSAYKSWRSYNLNGENSSTNQRGFFKAVLINTLNPAPYIGWSLILGPQLMSAWKQSPNYGIVLLVGFYGTLIICTAGMVILFAAAKRFGPRVTKISLAISCFAFAAFGIYQLWTGIVA